MKRSATASSHATVQSARRDILLLALMMLTAATALVLSSWPSKGQPVDGVFKDKTITVIVGYAAGGPPDAYGRLVARHLGANIPGKPNVIVQNMPGAGSINASNHLFSAAAKDGTALGVMTPTIAIEEAVGSKAVRYKAGQFNWIGRIMTNPNATYILATSAVKKIEDAYEKVATLGATGVGAANAIYPNVLNSLLGTKFKVVVGYESSGAVMLAMERGEVEGHSSTYDGLKAVREDWITSKRVNVVVQYMQTRSRSMPDVPTAVELAKTPEQKAILSALCSGSDIGKYVAAPPGLPADRVALLRTAFDATVASPEFLADAKKSRMDIDPLPGAGLQKIVQSIQSLSPDLIEKLKAVYPLQ